MMSQSTNQDDVERQFLSDLERATALSLETKAFEDIKRQHIVPPNSSVQDYQKILKQREQSFNQTRRSSTSHYESRTFNLPTTNLATCNSKSVDVADQPDLISFTSPTSGSASTSSNNNNINSSQSQFAQLFEQVQKLSLQTTTTTSFNNPGDMQVVPYQQQHKKPQNIPLTPAYLTQLYNMNNHPVYVLPSIQPAPTTAPPIPYHTHPNINAVNNYANIAFRPNYGKFPTSYSSTFHPKVEPEPLPAPPKTSTPKSSIPSSYSQVQLRRPTPSSFDDNLIDLGHDDRDLNDSRVSVLEAFDPLILRADEADETSSEYYSEYDPFDYLYSEKTEFSDPVYEAVNKSDKLPPSSADWKYSDHGIVPPPLPPRNSNENAHIFDLSENYVTRQKLSIKLYQSIVTQKLYDPELMSFYKMVLKVRQRYKFNDYSTNPGYVIASELPTYYSNSTSIKLVVYPSSKCFIRPVESNGEKRPIEGYETPIVFTCDISTTVEHVLSQCICQLEGQINGGCDDFMLKPIGVLEWLRPSSKLSQLETVHNSIKLEKDVQFGLCPRTMVTIMSIGRTHKDDLRDSEIKIEDVLPNEVQSTINYDSLLIILETIEAEIDRLEASAQDGGLSCSGVTQAVKAVCSLLGSIETIEISDTVQILKNVCNNSDAFYGSKMDIVSENGDYAEVTLRSRTLPEQIKVCCNKIRVAVKQLLSMYSQVFRVNFIVNVNDNNLTSKSLASITQSVMIQLTCLYRLPPYWKYDDYLLGTQIYHGTRYIGDAKVAQCIIENSGAYPRLKFKSWLNFENIPVCVLPRESRLVFVLYGCINEPHDGNSNEIRDGSQYQQVKTELGWFSIQFFDFDAVLIQGSYLLPLWPPTTDKYLGPAPGKGTHPNCNDYPVLGIDVPDFGGQIKFPETPTTSTAPRLDFNSLDINLQQELIDTAQQGYQNAADQREVLWEKRYYLQKFPHALPKVLHAAHSWDFASLVDLHALIRSWNPLSPIQALELLLPRYPDLRVRTYAVEWFSAIATDQLVDYLPQLVQALKHDTYEASSLSFFLLSRSLESPRVAHYLYWLLVQNLPGDSPQNSSMELSQTNIDEMLIAQSRYHRRNQLLLRALLATCGEKLSSRFLTQNIMCKNLADIAQSVKSTKDTHRQKILFQKLQIINQQLIEQPTSLPLGPGLEVNGVNCRTSSYFNSNTLPLKINFIGPDNETIPAIFKCGDDLQQDMLTLQLVRIMDKLWLRDGLDLKIVTFNCIPTGYKKGMIELVSEAETLRKIQVEWGLTGSFKDKPIAEWLARQNPSNLEYHRAVDNFTASCAGYSVATYVLGICDRHNDNIMLQKSGHLFHIDFGKFLGDAQMIGNFKRDRTPFVLTSDMAYVINGGEKPSTKFHHFVDMCCQAFNIVRKHGDFLLHMLALMATSGIPGVTADSVNYVRKALLPGQSNPEAAASFAKMIHISLKSWFTQVNFFLHNIAQMRFTNEEGSDELLSFVPRTYTLIQDGRLKSVTVHGYQKRYELEKYYTYILKVTRQNQPDPSYLFRSYKEFLEFHQKLCLHFPLAKLHSLQSGLHVGRSHIKTVAERRLPEIQQFLVSLFNSADEIAHSDLVYTFFHPLLRDQQEANINIRKVKELKNVPSQERKCGQIKISLQYLRGALTVMIHHARSLPLTANGQEPNTYVKCYLKPDPSKLTKRKTKVVKKSCFPSFMETLEYRMPRDIVQCRTLEITIWSHDSLQENEFLGGIQLVLGDTNLREELIQWCDLRYLPRS